MAEPQSVDYDPFAPTPASGANAPTPVDYDPFASRSPKGVDLKLTPAPKESKLPPLSERAGALAYGAGTGLVGGLGELEKLGAYTVPEMLGLREEGSRDKYRGRETLFPTIEEARKGLSYLGIEPPPERVKGYVSSGEVLSGFSTALPGLLKGGTKVLTGVPTATRELIARDAEKLGFKLSPAQVKGTEPVPSRGATGYKDSNQNLSNTLVSKATGREVKEIDEKFIGERFKTLGKEFDDIYKGKQFNIDSSAIDAVRQIANIENVLPAVAQVPAVKQTANKIVENYDKLASQLGKSPASVQMAGEDLQLIRNSLTEAARTTSSKSDARSIYKLVDAIDESIAKYHPEVANKLDVLRPKYRNTIILDDLLRSGGIEGGDVSLERLGNMLRGDAAKSVGELDRLGVLGRNLRLRARWEGTGAGGTAGEDILKKALGTTLGGVATATGLRSRPARAVQSLLARRNIGAAERAGMASEAGQIPGQVEQALENE